MREEPFFMKKKGPSRALSKENRMVIIKELCSACFCWHSLFCCFREDRFIPAARAQHGRRFGVQGLNPCRDP